MALFRRKKTQAQSQPSPKVQIQVQRQSSVSILWTKEFEHSSNFRGFRRIRLAHNGNEKCLKTLDKYRDSKFAFKGCPIKIECLHTVDDSGEYDSINVYVNGDLIGRVPVTKDKELHMLTDYDYDAVSLMVDEKYHADGSVMGQNVYLFVHYVGEEPPK